jgi:hypothetical protein
VKRAGSLRKSNDRPLSVCFAGGAVEQNGRSDLA